MTVFIYALLFISLYFQIFLLLTFLSNTSSKKISKTDHRLQDANLPSTTIIVPCYNEEKTLSGTIRSLLALDYPKDKLSILIVNDGSVDNTLKIAQEFSKNYPQVRVLDKENGGKASAMNLALVNSESELIGCLDADSFVDPEALKLISTHFTCPKQGKFVSAVTPAIMIYKPRGILQMMQRTEYMLAVFMRKAFSIIDAIVVTPGPFSIFRKADILSVTPDGKPYWEHAHGTEDFEMGLRLQKNHKKITNEPMAKVMTISPNTLGSLYKQRIRWTYGFLMNTWDYKFMLGNIKYGNVGILVLPAALLSLIFGVLMFMILIARLIMSIFDFIIRIYTTGISLGLPTIDLFYVNINSMLLIVIVLISSLLTILYISTRISKTKIYKKDTVLYLILYGFIAPLWLTGALARALVRAESKWKVIR